VGEKMHLHYCDEMGRYEEVGVTSDEKWRNREIYITLELAIL
jgi:hypothetical protein